jgi:hypothetical protein
MTTVSSYKLKIKKFKNFFFFFRKKKKKRKNIINYLQAKAKLFRKNYNQQFRYLKKILISKEKKKIFLIQKSTYYSYCEQNNCQLKQRQ